MGHLSAMDRRCLLLLPLGLLAPPALAQTAPRPPAPSPGNSVDRSAVQRIEAYLNAMGTLRARFLQIAQNGASAEGLAWISRPGRMRFDYDPPEPILLVASGGQVMMLDRQLGQPSIVPAASTPLGLLLRDEIRLSGDVTVVATERSGGLLRIALARTGQPAEGRLTLVFDENPMQLRQWAVLDSQGRETRVTLSAIDTSVRPDNRIFDFNDPRFLETEGIRR